MSITWGEVVSIIAALGALYSIWNQRRYDKARAELTEAQRILTERQANATASQTDSENIKDALELKKQYKEDLQSLRAEIEDERIARSIVEEQLRLARVTISELQERDIKREAAMQELKSQFERDTALRANIEELLRVANVRIKTLEADNVTLKTDNKSNQDEIAKLHKELTIVISFAREVYNGARLNYKFIEDHGLAAEAPYKPPEKFPTGPLGATA